MKDTPSTKTVSRMINSWIRNQHLAAATVLILLLVVFYRDVVFEGRTFLMETAVAGTMPYPPGGPYQYKGIAPKTYIVSDPGAIAWQTEPFNRFLSKSVKRGDFPLWNPYIGLAGGPLLADGHTGPLEPLQFLFFFVPDRFWPYTVDIQLLIRFFIAGFSCYLFARRIKIDFIGSISSGALFMLSSYFVMHGNHPQIKTEMLLPLILYGYDRLAAQEKKQDYWLCALLIGWAVIAAMPESTFFSLFLGTLWYFYKSILHTKDGGTLGEFRTSLRRFMGSTVTGILISAVYLLPFLELLLLSKTTHDTSSIIDIYPLGTGSEIHPLWKLPILIFQSAVQHSPFLTVGFFTMLLLVYSLLSVKNWSEYRRQIFFFGTYCVFFLLLKFDFPPINFLRSLPLFNQINLTKYPQPSIVFCLAMLAGIFIHMANKYPLSYKRIIFSLFIVYIFFIFIPALNDPHQLLMPYFSDSNELQLAVGGIIGLTITLYLLALLRNEYGYILFTQIGLFLLIISEPFFWGSYINRPNRVDSFQLPPFVDYLRDKKETFRIFGTDSILYPNVSTAYGVSDIRWLNALMPERVFDFTGRFITDTRELDRIRFTGTSFPISDRMFDLLNVKYLLSAGKDTSACGTGSGNKDDVNNQSDIGIIFEKSTINELIFQQNPNKNLEEQDLTIGDSTRTAILAHPFSEFDVKVHVPKMPASLDFSIGLNPSVFRSNRGDGVDYEITLIDANNKFNIFSKYIDPKQNPCDRQWFDESINLDDWAGKDVILRFSTSGGPAENISWDWAYWGNIRVTNSSDHYPLVYNKRNILIFQNENVFPRAFLVHSIINASNFSKALDLMDDPNLDLRQIAVVENPPGEWLELVNQNNTQTGTTPGNVKFLNSGELDVEVDTKVPGLLVVSEQYYPGWRASIDGVPAPIYAVDGIFRGVFLDKGSHLVKFTYRPASFIIGAFISIVFLLTSFIFIFLNLRLSGRKNE